MKRRSNGEGTYRMMKLEIVGYGKDTTMMLVGKQSAKQSSRRSARSYALKCESFQAEQTQGGTSVILP